MIYVADLNMFGKIHVPFDSAFIEMLKMIFHDDVCFYSEEEHIKNISKNCHCEVEYRKRKFFEKKRGLYIFLKEVVEFINFLIINKEAKKDGRAIFILAAFAVNNIFIRMYRTFEHKIPLYIVLHGELEYMREERKRNLIFFGWLWKVLLNNIYVKNTKYIVLGDSIKRELVEKFGDDISKSIISLDHPYVYGDDDNLLGNNNLDKPIRIGSVGEALLAKNSQYIFEIAKRFYKEINNNDVNFEIIGRMEEGVRILANDYVDYSRTNDLLDEKMFAKKVTQINYMIFFYNDEHYTLSASGAFFDAVKYEKPIISLKNKFFEEYFLRYGDIGYMCDSLDEINKCIAQIITGDEKDRYIRQCKKLKKMKKDLSLKNIGERLKQSL